jgi:hypothetical protein
MVVVVVVQLLFVIIAVAVAVEAKSAENRVSGPNTRIVVLPPTAVEHRPYSCLMLLVPRAVAE